MQPPLSPSQAGTGLSKCLWSGNSWHLRLQHLVKILLMLTGDSDKIFWLWPVILKWKGPGALQCPPGGLPRALGCSWTSGCMPWDLFPLATPLPLAWPSPCSLILQSQSGLHCLLWIFTFSAGPALPVMRRNFDRFHFWL